MTRSSKPLAAGSVRLASIRTTKRMSTGMGMPVRRASFMTAGLPIRAANARPRVKCEPHWSRT